MNLSDSACEAIERECAKYPAEQRRSATLAALFIVQAEYGWLRRELMDAVAGQLGLQPIEVYEVATFYSLYDLKPAGRHRLYVCSNVSCMLCGSDEVMAHLKQRLGIGPGETTSDGRFSLYEVECLAACGGAPAMQVGMAFHENLTAEKIDRILEELP